MTMRNKHIKQFLAIILIIPLVSAAASICEPACCTESHDTCQMEASSECLSFERAAPVKSKVANLASTLGAHDMMHQIVTLLPTVAWYHSNIHNHSECTNTRITIPLSVPLLV